MATLQFRDYFVRADNTDEDLDNDWVWEGTRPSSPYAIDDNRLVTEENLVIVSDVIKRPPAEALLDSLVSIVVNKLPSGGSQDFGLSLHHTSDSQRYLAQVDRDGINIASQGNQSWGPGLEDTAYRVSFASYRNGSQEELEVRVALNSSPNVAVATATEVLSGGSIQAAGVQSLNIGSDVGVLQVFEFSVYDFSDETWPTFDTVVIPSVDSKRLDLYGSPQERHNVKGVSVSP